MTEPRRYGFRSLRFKLVLASVVIEVIMLTALVWNSARITGNALTEISQNHLESLIPLLNASLATPLVQRDYATLDERLGLIVRRESLVYVEVRDELGKLAAVRGKVPETAEYNTSLSEPADGIFNQTFDITVANRVIGRARYGLNVTLRETTMASLRRQGAVVAFTEIVITFLLLSALGFFLTRHLRSLAQASRALGQGDYSVRVTAVGRDEVADTATAFNAMAATVEFDIAEREHAADELRRNEERYQLVAQASNDVIWDWDIRLSTLWWNQNFSKLFGYPPEEIKPGLDSWTERVHPDDIERVLTGLYSVLDHGGASWSDDYRFRHHDGSYAYIFDQGYVLRDDRGKAIRMVGAMVDVSARRQASEQTRILSSALEQTADSVIVTDRNGVIEYVNPAFETVTGYSAAEALGRNPNIVKSGEHDLAFYRQLWNTILKGEPYRAVIVNRRKDGVLYHEGKSIMPLRDANGAITHFVSTGKDITERIRAEESRHRQALIFENLTDAVMVIDNSRRILEWNSACEKLFGYTKAEAIGSTTLLIQSQDEFESYDRVVSESIERHGHWAGERTLRRKDGSKIICEAVRVALWDRNRRTVGRIVINRDITERKHSEQALRESEERLRLALEAAHLGTFDWDVPNNEVTWSHWHDEIWGLKPGEFGGTYESFSERVHPDDKPDLSAEMARCMAEHAPFRHEFRVVWPDGSTHWVSSHGEFTFGADGQPQRMRGVVREITALKRAEAALRESEAHFRTIFEQATDGIFIVDMQTHYLDVNTAGCQLLGYSREELLGLSVADTVAPEELPRIEPEIVWLRDGHVIQSERWMVRRDGSRLLVEVAAKQLPDGRLQCFIRDITARKQAEAALREGEEILRLFVEHSPAAIGMLDNDMRYVVVSRRWMSDYGLADRNIIGRSHYDIFPEIPQRWRDIHRRCLAGATERCDEEPFVRADGHTDWMKWEICPWRKADGGIGGIIIFSEMITERKRAEHEIAEGATRLEQMSRQLLSAQEDERRRLARELHDELGQSLTAIKINLESRERFKGQSPTEVDATNIHLIEDTLQQVRRLALALRPSMLDDLGLPSALRWMADQEAKRGGFVVHFGADFPEARLSPELEITCFRIAQAALTNIVRHAQASRVTIELHHEGDALVMTVQDDGCGFDVAEMHTRAMAGDSIGILSMQERATLIGGRLTIESTPRRGTKVSAHFPWRAREEIA